VLFSIAIAATAASPAPTPEANWSGPYKSCVNRVELLKSGHMDLGVRFDTANADIAAAFRRALGFWSNVLDVSFYEDASPACALALVDGTPEVLRQAHNVARAQFADLANFQGWIAFDPHASEYMSPDEMYATAVHELGHLFGLRHNPRASSIMYYLDCDGSSTLDQFDLQALALHHALRAGIGYSVPILP
jgi:predicted Zn-dependent protease